MKEYIFSRPDEADDTVKRDAYYRGELIRCKDCEDCTETKLYDGQRWNYCMRLRCVVQDDDFCSWAERKYPKIKAKVTE